MMTADESFRYQQNHHPQHALECFLIIVLSLFLTHLIMMFYNKEFEWNNIHPVELFGNPSASLQLYSDSQTTFWKALVCFVVVATILRSVIYHNHCLGDNINVIVQQGRMLTVALALPQLYRLKGPSNQQLRVILGPLTPLLAIHNACLQPSVPTLVVLWISCLAFVVFRPDNLAVLNLVTTAVPTTKTRRKIHGTLAASNAAVTLWFWILHMGQDSIRSVTPEFLTPSAGP